MTHSQSQATLHHVLGPQLKKWLEQQQPQVLKQASSQKDMDHIIQAQVNNNKVKSEAQLASLVDELVTMNKPQLALDLIDHNQAIWSQEDFMGLRSEGIAAMLTKHTTRAIRCFKKAIFLNPNEAAPYVNLSQLYGHNNDWNQALQYCLTGLKRAKNYPPLWESLWLALKQTAPSTAQTKLEQLAQEMDAWAGLSLLYAITQPHSQQAQLDNMVTYYAKGTREHDFLLEYTGLLGNLEQYDTIEQILSSQATLSWQLQLHQLQAHLALDKHQLFLEQASKLLKQPTLPHKNRRNLEQLLSETKANIKAHSVMESQDV